MREHVKKIILGTSTPTPNKLQLGSILTQKQWYIYSQFNLINAMTHHNLTLDNEIENIPKVTSFSKDIKPIEPVMDITHPAMIVGISKSHFLLAGITHGPYHYNKQDQIWHYLIGPDLKGRDSYMGSPYLYIPIEYIALYINTMNRYKVTDKQSQAVIDKSLNDVVLNSNKEIFIREVVQPGEPFKDHHVLPKYLKMQVMGDAVNHENIGETLEKLNLRKNITKFEETVYRAEYFKNDINHEYLKSIEKKSWDE